MSHIPARRRALRVATVLSVAATATVLGAAPAFAHVTAQPDQAPQAYAMLNRERETAMGVGFEWR